MKTVRFLYLTLIVACGQLAVRELRAEEARPIRTQDVIYGRKYGTALTMDVFTPGKPNGLGVVFVVSGGWQSSHEMIEPQLFASVLRRGYTIFAVVHSSQPKFTIPEILTDMHRSVRFIRYHAADYRIDPARIGIMGTSSGGHIALMQGMAGAAGDAQAADPVDRENSRVQAVACFFPPTDFFNYGSPGENALGRGILEEFRAAFDFQKLDTVTHHFVPVTDDDEIQEIGRQISPVTQVTAGDPPTFIMHGDEDRIVPIQQSVLIIGRLKVAGVKAKLVVKPGEGHGWVDLLGDVPLAADWFDQTLAAKK